MKAFFDWIRSWFAVTTHNRTILSLQRKIDRLRKERESSDLVLNRQRQKLEVMKVSLVDEINKSMTAINEAEKTNKKLSEALDGTQEALKTATDITIPALVSSHQIIVSRWEAETAVLSMRTALNESRET